MSSWLMDLRYAARLLRKNPGVTLVIALVLALGIGANTTIFSIVNPFFLRPLPYDQPGRLLHLFLTDAETGQDRVRLSLPQFLDWRTQSESFSELAVYDYSARNVGFMTHASGATTSPDLEPEQQIVGRLSANLLPMLGAEPRIGRTFAADEDSPGAAGLVLLSDELFKRRYGGREDVVGETLRIDGEPHTVIGIMPPRFHFPYPEVKLWTALPADVRAYGRDRRRFLVVGRLADGVTPEVAKAELATIEARLAREYAPGDDHYGVAAVPLRQALLFGYRELRLLMLLLTAAVGFVLLIVAANVANMLLARAGARAQEVAIRTSLGAGRRRLVRQFLTESLLLALLGGGLGVLLALYGVRSIGGALPEALYRVGGFEIDALALAFTTAVAIASALLFGLVPALRGTRVDLSGSLKEGGRGGEGGVKGRRLRGLLVVSQLTLAVVLLSGALLMLGNVSRMKGQDLGFETGEALTMRLVLPDAKYPEAAQRAAFFGDLTRRLEALPGIDAAAAVLPLPLSFSTYGVEFEVPGREPTSPGERLSAHRIYVTPRYFDALGIRLARGRVFDRRDTADSAPVVVVNEALAERFWADAGAVGRGLRLRLRGGEPKEVTVAGVVADVRDAPEWQGGLADAQIYLPWAQHPQSGGHLVVRSAGGDPAALAPQVRAELRRADAELPVSEVWTMERVTAYSVSPLETASRAISGFAAAAMLLAAVGIYGVVAYTTSRRRHELGIRLALGAGRGSILRLVLRQGAALAGLGLGLGLAAAFALGRVVASQIPGLAGPGVLSLGAVALVLGAAAFAASYLPARRAARMDPLAALRHE